MSNSNGIEIYQPHSSGTSSEELEELKKMVHTFRVHELQHLLGFANRSRSGKKPELIQRAFDLIRSTKNLSIQQKIKELYRRRMPDRVYNSVGETGGTGNSYIPPSSYLGETCSSNSGSAANTAASSGQSSFSLIDPLSMSQSTNSLLQKAYRRNITLYPDVKLMPLPFYDVLNEVIRPTSLVPLNNDRYQDNYVTFRLTQSQLTELAFNDAATLPRVELQLRFCLSDVTTEQKDDFPSGCSVRLNEKPVQLPNPIPTNKPEVEPKRPSRPVNITPFCRRDINLQRIQILWNHDGSRHWTVSVFIVRHVTATILLQRLRAKGERSASCSTTMIKEKLSCEGEDDDIATTSLRVPLLCPLGKMRMQLPCRLRQCTHLQCFDAELFLKMNEKRPTWTCPVCDKHAPFDDLQIDGYFVSVLDKTSDNVTEVELYEDGTWSPIVEEDEPSPPSSKRSVNDLPPMFSISPKKEIMPTSGDFAKPAPTNAAQAKSPEEVSIIDLTEDDSDDDAAASSSSSAAATISDSRRMKMGSRSQSASNSPSIIVLDSPPSRPNATPEDPGELLRNIRQTNGWSSEQNKSYASSEHAPPQKKLRPDLPISEGLRLEAVTPPATSIATSNNALNSILSQSMYMQPQQQQPQTNGISSNSINCSIPFLQASMDFNNSNAYAAMNRFFANGTMGHSMFRQTSGSAMSSHIGQTPTSSVSTYLNMPPPLRFGPANGYLLNAGYNAAFGSQAFMDVSGGLNTVSSTTGSGNGDSAWDPRWDQDFDEFLNSFLPDSSSS